MPILMALRWPIISRIPLGGDLAISPHGIGIAAGFVVGAWMLIQRARKRGVGHHYVPDISEAVQQLLGRIALGAILGARLFYVLTHLDQYGRDPLSIVAIWEGGLTFLGGVAGAVIVAAPWAVKQGWRPLQLLDSAMPGLAAGLAIGRIGDLMIGDHIGGPTSFFLGWRCGGDFNPPGGSNAFGFVPPGSYDAAVASQGAQPTIGCFDTLVHQTALYDFGAAVFVLLLLLWLERRARFDGFFTVAWVYGYGVVRFAGDFAREDRRLFGLTGSQYALLAAAAAATVWLIRARPWERLPWAWDLEFDHPWLTAPAAAADHDGDQAEAPEATRAVDVAPGSGQEGEDPPV